MEIYGKCGDEDILISSGKLISGDIEIEGDVIEIENGGNVLYFHQLEFEKEYILEIEAQGFEIKEPQKYLYNLQEDKYFVSFIEFNKSN